MNKTYDDHTLRHQYRVLTDEEKKAVDMIKSTGQHFLNIMKTLGTSRELSLAGTKMEEAVMWAVKHITK